MSWYTIDHACGHSRETQLYGKTSGREDKVAYMAGQDCPQCWGAKKREAESKMPIAMTVRTNGLDTDPVGNIMAEIILTGGTVPRKDEIKALGYHWAEVRGGVLSMLSMSAPDKAWIKTAPLAELADATSAANRAMTADAKALGITQIKNGIGPLDIAMAQKRIADKTAIDAKIAEVQKPTRPTCHPYNNGKKWNGTYYGKPGNHSYYVDGKQHMITSAEYTELTAYSAAIREYNKKIEDIKHAT